MQKIISRIEAREQGLTHFYTDQPCARGHITTRFVSDGHCTECNKEKRRKAYVYKPRRRVTMEETAARVREWKQANKTRVRDSERRCYPRIKLPRIIARTLRMRLYSAARGEAKTGSAVRDLGCSVEFFKQYIEDQFHSGMAWGNWGKVWQLDHIEPFMKFDLTDHNQVKIVCNYRNIQPMLIEDHKAKTIQEFKDFLIKRAL